MRRVANFKKKGVLAKQLTVAWCLIFALSQNLFAAEETDLDVQPSIFWLSSDVSASVFDDNQYNSFLGSSELWTGKWGLSATLLDNTSNGILGLADNSEYFNVDVKRRFGNKNRSNFELGLGWQELNIDSQLDASGPRVSVTGNLKLLKSFKLYGSTSYFPELDDSINDSTATAYEFEAGFLYSPLPSLSVKAGYRVFNLDLSDPVIDDLGSSTGFLLGSDLSW